MGSYIFNGKKKELMKKVRQREKTIKNFFDRLNRIQSILTSESHSSLKKVVPRAGGATTIYTILKEKNVIQKKNGEYKWNESIPVSIKLATTIAEMTSERRKRQEKERQSKRKEEHLLNFITEYELKYPDVLKELDRTKKDLPYHLQTKLDGISMLIGRFKNNPSEKLKISIMRHDEEACEILRTFPPPTPPSPTITFDMIYKYQYLDTLKKHGLTKSELPNNISSKITTIHLSEKHYNNKNSDKMKDSIIELDVKVCKLIEKYVKDGKPKSNRISDKATTEELFGEPLEEVKNPPKEVKKILKTAKKAKNLKELNQEKSSLLTIEFNVLWGLFKITIN